MKNLALIAGKPMISYAIEAAKAARVFTRIVVNSDDCLFKEVAAHYGAEFYKREPNLGSSTTKSEEVVFDFVRRYPCDILVWVNPTSPLQPPEEIREVVDHFVRTDLDSLITVQDHRVHCIYRDAPVNFRTNEMFARTQDLLPVQSFVYSLMMWRTVTFVAEIEERGHAMLCGKIGYYPVGKLSSLIVKTAEDLLLVDALARARPQLSLNRVEYDSIVNNAGGV